MLPLIANVQIDRGVIASAHGLILGIEGDAFQRNCSPRYSTTFSLCRHYVGINIGVEPIPDHISNGRAVSCHIGDLTRGPNCVLRCAAKRTFKVAGKKAVSTRWRPAIHAMLEIAA
jgi:hypothetical protein